MAQVVAPLLIAGAMQAAPHLARAIGSRIGEGIGKMISRRGGGKRMSKLASGRISDMATGAMNKAVLAATGAGAAGGSAPVAFKNGGQVPTTFAGKSSVGPSRRRGRQLLRGIYNKRPRDYRPGGKVSGKRDMNKWQKKNDSISALLQPGELVVPTKYYQKGSGKPINLAAETIKKFKEIGIKLPNT